MPVRSLDPCLVALSVVAVPVPGACAPAPGVHARSHCACSRPGLRGVPPGTGCYSDRRTPPAPRRLAGEGRPSGTVRRESNGWGRGEGCRGAPLARAAAAALRRVRCQGLLYGSGGPEGGACVLRITAHHCASLRAAGRTGARLAVPPSARGSAGKLKSVLPLRDTAVRSCYSYVENVSIHSAEILQMTSWQCHAALLLLKAQ